jgi:hypothetical protein
MLSGLIMQPSDVRSAKKDEADLRGAIRTTRTWDNRHLVQPILDAAPAKRRGSVAEAQCKSGSRPAPSEECSFSSRMIRAVSRLPPFRVCGIFRYYLRGNPYSLVRDRDTSGSWPRPRRPPANPASPRKQFQLASDVRNDKRTEILRRPGSSSRAANISSPRPKGSCSIQTWPNSTAFPPNP